MSRVLAPTFFCVLFLATAYGADQVIRRISHDELGNTVEITGSFGQALGKYVTVKGRVLTSNEVIFKDWDAACVPLQVTSVDGKALPEPAIIAARFQGEVESREASFLGYQTGRMDGTPPDMLKLIKVPVAAIPWRFRLTFHVLRTERRPGER